MRVSERDVQTTLIEGLQLLGYRVCHFRPARTARGWRTPVEADGVGFPDLIAVGHGILLAVEVKAKGGRLREDQEGWLEALGGVEGEVYAVVCYPDDVSELLELAQTKRDAALSASA